MGAGGGVGCSSQRDARSSSLQRMVRRRWHLLIRVFDVIVLRAVTVCRDNPRIADRYDRFSLRRVVG